MNNISSTARNVVQGFVNEPVKNTGYLAAGAALYSAVVLGFVHRKVIANSVKNQVSSICNFVKNHSRAAGAATLAIGSTAMLIAAVRLGYINPTAFAEKASHAASVAGQKVASAVSVAGQKVASAVSVAGEKVASAVSVAGEKVAPAVSVAGQKVAPAVSATRTFFGQAVSSGKGLVEEYPHVASGTAGAILGLGVLRMFNSSSAARVDAPIKNDQVIGQNKKPHQLKTFE